MGISQNGDARKYLKGIIFEYFSYILHRLHGVYTQTYHFCGTNTASILHGGTAYSLLESS